MGDKTDEFRHYLPRVYLKYFGDNKNKTYIYSLKEKDFVNNGCSIPITGKNTPFGSEYFYNDDVENGKLHTIEKPIGNFFKELNNKVTHIDIEQLINTHQQELALFIENLYWRNNYIKEMVYQTDKDEVAKIAILNSPIAQLGQFNIEQIQGLLLNQYNNNDNGRFNENFNKKFSEGAFNDWQNKYDTMIYDFLIKTINNQNYIVEINSNKNNINIDNPVMVIENNTFLSIMNKSKQITSILFILNKSVRVCFGESKFYFEDVFDFIIKKKQYSSYIFCNDKKKIENILNKSK